MQDEIKHLLALFAQGKYRDLIGEAARLSSALGHTPVFHNILGAAHAGLRDWDEAEASYARALELKPDYAEAHNNRGIAFNDRGMLDAAVASFRRALEIRPDYAEAHNNLGVAFRNRGLLDDAVASYRRAIEIRLDYAEAHNNLGIALNDQGAVEAAAASYRRALEVRPDYAEAHSNLGATLLKAGAVDQAIACYRRALEIRPDFAEAHNNLGAALKHAGALDEAVACCRRALEIRPDYAEAHNNLGVALKNKGLLDEAVASYGRALEIRPDYAEAHANLGAVLVAKGALVEAVASYRRALEIRPEDAEARAKMLHQQAHLCDWAALEEAAALVPVLGVEGAPVSPFALIAMEDDPARHRIRSERHARAEYAHIAPAVFPRPDVAPTRLRVGYFSADLHNHATMHLIARLFECHDRARFEIVAYSYGPDRQEDDQRRRAVRAVDAFHDVRHLSDTAVAALARAHGLHLAVDLKGYTENGRPGIFAFRAAPVQISYLGYPGTLGAPFMDYLVADPTVIPDEQQPHYSESVIYLPDSYQVNDDTRQVAAPVPTRAEQGLPEDGFVFCCFNNSYKIGAAEFDFWMRLLRAVEGSVLWLFRANPWAEKNLKEQAAARGVDPARIVFAGWADPHEHLSRHRLADLFLDTFTYNAHTTASDALWAGLPVVTTPGRGFAARVGASLVSAVGLPELIADTRQAYEQRALELATNPDRLRAVRRKLETNRTTAPLFDTVLFASHIEDAYRQAYGRFVGGQAPATIRVGPSPTQSSV